MSFFEELKRRNVVRVGVAYVLAAWVLLQVAEFFLEAFAAPPAVLRYIVLAAAIGLPVILGFAWVFELTPEGIRREDDIDRERSIAPQTGRKLDRAIIVFLGLAVVGLLVDRFYDPPATEERAADGTMIEAPAPVSQIRQSIAVLPFLALSSGEDDEYFADGLAEEILNSLAQLPELLVTARTSSFHFKGTDLPLQDIASQLGVDHIVEGSVRRSGERLRVTAQLIRAHDGFHMWSDNFDSTAADTIAVQEEIAEKIATAMDVVLDVDKRERMRRAGLRDVEAFITLQKAQKLFDEAHGSDDIIGMLRETNQLLDDVISRVPESVLAYQLHSDLYIHILLNEANGIPISGAKQDEIDNALQLALDDYRNVIEHARTPEERHNAELDLAALSHEWRNIGALVERYGRESSCALINWVDNVAIPFGYAAMIVDRAHGDTLCDPFLTNNWQSYSRFLLWSGDKEGALAVAREGLETAPGDWVRLTHLNSLVALGQLETAEREALEGYTSESFGLYAQIFFAAAIGDREKFDSLFAEFDSLPGNNTFWRLAAYAWSGDAEEANRLASIIDDHPFGAFSLATAVMWCHCGAPFDISVTPNFATLVDDAGLPWPPEPVLELPLKDW